MNFYSTLNLPVFYAKVLLSIALLSVTAAMAFVRAGVCSLSKAEVIDEERDMNSLLPLMSWVGMV